MKRLRKGPSKVSSLGSRGQLYLNIFQHASVGIVLMDVDEHIIECNAAFAAMLGYTVESAVGLTLKQVTHPDEYPDESRRFRQAIRTATRGYRVQIEKRYMHKDGRVVWGRITITIIFGSTNKPVFVLGMVEDITERKKLGDDYRMLNQSFEYILGVTHTRLAIIDTDYNILYIDPEWRQLLGEFNGRKCFEYFLQREAACAGCALARALATRKEVVIERVPLREPDRVMEVHNIPFQDNAGRWLAAEFNVDVTERKRTEHELRETKERLEYILGLTKTNIDIIDGDFVLHYVDPVWRKIYGEPAGRKCYDYFMGRNAPCLACGIPRALRTKQTTVTEEILPRENNRPIEVHTIPFKNAAGEWLVAEFNIDITEKRRLEQESLKTQKVESLSLLAGGVAHDFNNFLTAIVGNISLAKQGLRAEQGNTREMLDEAERASVLAQNLARQLMSFARGSESEKQVLNPVDVVRESTTFAMRGSATRINFEIGEGVWAVEVDPGQISQVIHNLVINAEQAMPEVGSINIGIANREVDVGAGLPLKSGKYVMISVADTGIGIPAKHLDRIFDPYFSTKQRGRGLGLATSYAIIKQHGGHISVKSEVGKGTEFTIFLPSLGHRIDTAIVEQTPVNPKPSGSGRILVMDDEAMIRQLFQRMLESVGYHVTAVGSSDETIAEYTRAVQSGHPFDVVVLDLAMGEGPDGYETLRRLKALNPKIKAIVATGYSNTVLNSEHLNAGFDAVVGKPFRFEDINGTLRKVIGH